MKIYICLSNALVTIFLLVSNLNAQSSDSIRIKTVVNQGTNSKEYSWTSFKFFDVESKKQISVAAINVKGIKIVSDIKTGEIKIAFLPESYSIWINSPFYTSSRTFELKTNPANNYEVEIYLTQSKESLHASVE